MYGRDQGQGQTECGRALPSTDAAFQCCDKSDHEPAHPLDYSTPSRPQQTEGPRSHRCFTEHQRACPGLRLLHAICNADETERVVYYTQPQSFAYAQTNSTTILWSEPWHD